MRSSNWLGTWQIFNTLVPYGLLWWLAVVLLARGSWLLLPVLCLMVLFLARCFSLMHDCGHYSLFRHRPTNRWVGFLLGIVALIAKTREQKHSSNRAIGAVYLHGCFVHPRFVTVTFLPPG